MYRTIILAYDGSLEGRLALREGARLAQLCQARVVLVAVVEVGPEVYASDFGAIYASTDRSPEVQKILDEGLERLKRMGLSPEARLERGAPAERITSVAKEVAADLVVKKGSKALCRHSGGMPGPESLSAMTMQS